MRKYETMFVVRPGLDEEKISEVVDKFKGLIENNGGEILKVDLWGKRRLAYEVDHLREGYYAVIQFKSKPEVPTELDRVFKITDEILRFIIVKEDE